MRYLVAAVALTAMLGSGVAQAQTQLDHDVQRTWDNVFNPPPPGDPRTNWERHRDHAYERQRRQAAEAAAYRRRQEANRAEWCRSHPGSCGRY